MRDLKASCSSFPQIHETAFRSKSFSGLNVSARLGTNFVMMTMSTFIVHDSINVNAQCAEGRGGVLEIKSYE